jgi:hypothetical protein
MEAHIKTSKFIVHPQGALPAAVGGETRFIIQTKKSPKKEMYP